MSTVDQMLTFVEVVDANGFARAAQKLGVTPTAISKQIKMLEHELQQTLLHRTTRKISLTDFGEHFYQRCAKIKNEVSQLKALAHSKHEVPQGQLRIMCSTFIAKPFLLEYLCEFYQKYPQIELNIDLSERFPDLEAEHVDVLIGYTLLPNFSERLRQKKLYDSRYILVASPSYLKRRGKPITPEDLQEHRFINHPIRKPSDMIEFKNGEKVYLKPPWLLLNSGVTLIDICCQGAGICQVIEFHVKDKLKSGELVELLPNHPLKDIGVYLFYQYMQYEQLHVRAFIDFMCKIISN